MNSKKFLAVAALAAMASGSAFASTLVVNGSFEANTANGACATGWTCSSTRFGEEPVSFWNSQLSKSHLAASPDGGNVLATWYIDSPNSISQTLHGLTIGTTYTLSFDEASADRSSQSNAPGTIGWQVSVGGTTLGNANVAIPKAESQTPWSAKTFTFVANASNEALKFLSESSVAVAPEPILLLDGVSVQPQVTPVPEPSTWALTLGGLVGIAALARRRRQNDAS
ncbi:MAG: PEP-CTERM sorting domain-containing protein [Pseudomonadota bacterium]|nr:PEP-CTERM sorting domain-containing protein [Pseudomonadota bacterium]